MNVTAMRNYARLGSQVLYAGTIWRQLRNARTDSDGLRLLDAAANALAVLTAVLIIVREIRERRADDLGQAETAVEEAPL